MREIDFLPQWYRTGRKRRIWYYRQCVVLVAAAALLGLWCFAAGKSLSLAYAELRGFQADFESGVQKVQRYQQLRKSLDLLEKRADVLDAAIPRTRLWPVLAELSATVNSNIILSSVDFSQERFEKGEKASVPESRVLVRSGAGSVQNKGVVVSREPARTKIILAGIAAGGADVAELISRLEASSYFCRIQPIFSRDRKVKTYDVTEFEIHMYIADYKEVAGDGQ